MTFVMKAYSKIFLCRIRKVSFKGHIYYFSFSYDTIDKSEIFIIHKYAMVKNNIK